MRKCNSCGKDSKLSMCQTCERKAALALRQSLEPDTRRFRAVGGFVETSERFIGGTRLP